MTHTPVDILRGTPLGSTPDDTLPLCEPPPLKVASGGGRPLSTTVVAVSVGLLNVLTVLNMVLVLVVPIAPVPVAMILAVLVPICDLVPVRVMVPFALIVGYGAEDVWIENLECVVELEGRVCFER